MDDLFSFAKQNTSVPLAERMRPRSFDEFFGQQHIVGKGRLLRRAIEADRLTSCIFYGPPGCGKTSLASIVANVCSAHFEKLNAVTAGGGAFTASRRCFCWMSATAGARRNPTHCCRRWKTARYS